MIVRYHREGTGNPSLGSDIDLPATTAEVCRRNLGINLDVPGAVEQVAALANFRVHRIRSSLSGIEQLLIAHGPLFYAGISNGYQGISGGHAVVIRGVDGNDVLINDPRLPWWAKPLR